MTAIALQFPPSPSLSASFSPFLSALADVRSGIERVTRNAERELAAATAKLQESRSQWRRR